VRISRSQLSKALRKKFRCRRPRHTLKGRQTESEVERVGLRLQLRNGRPKRATSFFEVGPVFGTRG